MSPIVVPPRIVECLVFVIEILREINIRKIIGRTTSCHAFIVNAPPNVPGAEVGVMAWQTSRD